MAELNFNEEQNNLAKKLLDNVDMLIKKYAYIGDGFRISIAQIIDSKPFSEEDESFESLDSIQNKIEKLQKQTDCVVSELKNIVYSLSYKHKSKNATFFLDGLLYSISEAMYEFGKLEGCSSGDIRTSDDILKLKKCYEDLRDKLLEETEES